jgi:proteic killer suppression protein
MIKTFKSKALRRLYHTGSSADVPKERESKIVMVLDLMEAADSPDDLAMPGTGFHRLKGHRKHRYSMYVSANWRIVFEFDGEGFGAVNLEDYH